MIYPEPLTKFKHGLNFQKRLQISCKCSKNSRDGAMKVSLRIFKSSLMATKCNFGVSS